MIVKDEEALICDLAETYQIYDYKSLPCLKIAAFSVGLREDSRIKLKLSGLKYSLSTVFLAACVDRLTNLLWIQTQDGAKGRNRPKSIVEQLIQMEKDSLVENFDSPEAFEKRKKEILKRGGT